MKSRRTIEILRPEKDVNVLYCASLYTDKNEADIGYGVLSVVVDDDIFSDSDWEPRFYQQTYATLCPESHENAIPLRVQYPNGVSFAVARYSGKLPVIPPNYKNLGAAKLRVRTVDRLDDLVGRSRDLPTTTPNDFIQPLPIGTRAIYVTPQYPIIDFLCNRERQGGAGCSDVFSRYTWRVEGKSYLTSILPVFIEKRGYTETAIALYDTKGKMLINTAILSFHVSDWDNLPLNQKKIVFNLTFWG